MKFTIEFTEAEINVLLGGLGKLPLEVSVDLFAKIKGHCEKEIEKSKDKRNLFVDNGD